MERFRPALSHSDTLQFPISNSPPSPCPSSPLTSLPSTPESSRSPSPVNHILAATPPSPSSRPRKPRTRQNVIVTPPCKESQVSISPFHRDQLCRRPKAPSTGIGSSNKLTRSGLRRQTAQIPSFHEPTLDAIQLPSTGRKRKLDTEGTLRAVILPGSTSAKGSSFAKVTDHSENRDVPLLQGVAEKDCQLLDNEMPLSIAPVSLRVDIDNLPLSPTPPFTYQTQLTILSSEEPDDCLEWPSSSYSCLPAAWPRRQSKRRRKEPNITKSDWDLLEAIGVSHNDVQVKACKATFFDSTKISKCTGCIGKKTNDICRFAGIRIFLRHENLVAYSFKNAEGDQKFEFPNKWNRPATQEHLLTLKVVTANALLSTLQDELQFLRSRHASQQGVIRRFRETAERATCDFCSTSLFSHTWMCRSCGREACTDCASEIEALYQTGQEKLHVSHNGKYATPEARHRSHLAKCKKGSTHDYSDLIAMTRFDFEQLEAIVNGMCTLLTEVQGQVVPPIVEAPSKYPQSLETIETNILDTVSTDNWSDTTLVGVHEIAIYDIAHFGERDFQYIWAKREPFVLREVDAGFNIQWTPAYFTERYGELDCRLENCQTRQEYSTKVANFFSSYGKYNQRKETWKLKDWPPSEDFKSAFPDLFTDFHDAVPMPDYTRRDGVLNMVSRFPKNTLAPDVGPKMYNAFATADIDGTKGSTRLHMDMADAVNIMLHCERCPNGEEGFASWDLYHPRDSSKLRHFLNEEFPQADPLHLKDPIHSQQFYLDHSLRQKLQERYGVSSFRIHQRKGQAIFIPAGCAHQVLNNADCIKVAIDFVSPQSVTYCETLTREFREQNYEGCWKEDVLQLKSMMLYAWLSLSQREEEIPVS